MQDFTVADLIEAVDRLAPFELAEPWDNVGLQVGDRRGVVRRVAVALEVTPSVVAEARSHSAGVLIVHHPLIFKPLKDVSRDTPVGALVCDLLAAGIALIAAHTNLDASPAGTGGALADLLGLRDVGPLFEPEPCPAAYKLVVFVPEGHERPIIEAIARGGGGVIGAYDHCSFRSPGVGTYRPLEGAQPFAGEVGQFKEAAELRLEAEVPARALSGVLAEARAAHPYEEMAYDVYPRVRPATGYSLGLVGRLPRPSSAEALAKWLRRALPGGEPIALVGDPNRPVETLAVFSGSGRMAVERWRSQADALLTGEVDHHLAREAEARGLTLLAAGHYATERPVVAWFARRLREALAQDGKAAEVVEIESEASPFSAVY